MALSTAAQPVLQDLPQDALFVSTGGDLYVYRTSTEMLTVYDGCDFGADNSLVPWQPSALA
ncbi:MAG: hypothetical protein IPK19_25555 [Chloroflexi bacterium]|nr:hypothetical protein [Chloroflexota bacterium]